MMEWFLSHLRDAHYHSMVKMHTWYPLTDEGHSLSGTLLWVLQTDIYNQVCRRSKVQLRSPVKFKPQKLQDLDCSTSSTLRPMLRKQIFASYHFKLLKNIDCQSQHKVVLVLIQLSDLLRTQESNLNPCPYYPSLITAK